MLTKTDHPPTTTVSKTSIKEDLLHRLPIMTLAFVVWAILCFIYFQARKDQILVNWNSPDDALRLVQIRQWLAGASWFDLHISRMGFDDAYISHWSRLIDAPIGVMILFFKTFLDADRADYWAMVLWPLLPFALAIFSVVKINEFLGGRYPALVALISIFFLFPGHIQFTPGTIDHHNVQISLSLLFVYASLRAPSQKIWAINAGVIASVAIAIGIESLATLAIALAGYVLRFIFEPVVTRHLKPFGLSLAISSLLIFVLTTPSSRYAISACDAFAVNWLGLLMSGGLGLVGLDWLNERHMTPSWLHRIVFAGVIGMLALAVFLGIEPACVKGPFAQFDPQLFPLWLDHTQEMKSLLGAFSQSVSVGLSVYYFPFIALVLGIILCRKEQRPEIYILTVLLLANLILGCITVRQMIYAHWLGIILVSLYAWTNSKERLWSFNLKTIGLWVLINPVFLPSLTLLVPAEPDLGSASSMTQSCYQSSAYAELARLPPGLIFSDMNLASTILLLTPHRIVAAPYHRLNEDIVFAKEMMGTEPLAAIDALRKRRVTYVVNCAGFSEPIVGTLGPDKALFPALIAEQVPAELERLDLSPHELQVWRIRPKTE